MPKTRGRSPGEVSRPRRAACGLHVKDDPVATTAAIANAEAADETCVRSPTPRAWTSSPPISTGRGPKRSTRMPVAGMRTSVTSAMDVTTSPAVPVPKSRT